MPQDNREIEDDPPTASQDDIQEIRFHPDIEVETHEDPKYQPSRNVWCYASAKFKDHQGKTVTADFTKPAREDLEFEGWIVYTALPDELVPRSKSYETLHEPITKINRIAAGRHPKDDGGRARRWWESIYDLSL